jgi:hypothetical protein
MMNHIFNARGSFFQNQAYFSRSPWLAVLKISFAFDAHLIPLTAS